MHARVCPREETEGFQLPPDIDNYSFKQRDQIIKKNPYSLTKRAVLERPELSNFTKKKYPSIIIITSICMYIYIHI